MGEDNYFKEIYRWVKTEHIAKKCFVRGYLDLLIGSLAVRGEKIDRVKGEIKTEEYDLERIKKRAMKTKKQIDPRIYRCGGLYRSPSKRKIYARKNGKYGGTEQAEVQQSF